MSNPVDRCASCRERHIEHRRDGDRYICFDGGEFEAWPPLCNDDEDPAEFKRLTAKWRDVHDAELREHDDACNADARDDAMVGNGSDQQTPSESSRAALSSPEVEEVAGLREKIARIVDPSSWRVMDSYLAEMLRKYRGENAGYDPDIFKDKASLAKADAILALIAPRISRLEDELRAAREGLRPFMPISTRDNQDYAEVTFGEHQSQAMTMAPNDWNALNTVYEAPVRPPLPARSRGGRVMRSNQRHDQQCADAGPNSPRSHQQPDSDPFVAARFGGSPRTATRPASPWPDGITRLESLAGRSNSSSGQASASCCEPSFLTLCSCGENSLTTAPVSTASTAPSSATKGRSSRRSLSDRLTPLLMSSGLVRGITPTSTRRRSDQPLLALAFDTLDGGDVGSPKGACSSSNWSEAARDMGSRVAAQTQASSLGGPRQSLSRPDADSRLGDGR